MAIAKMNYRKLSLNVTDLSSQYEMWNDYKWRCNCILQPKLRSFYLKLVKLIHWYYLVWAEITTFNLSSWKPYPEKILNMLFRWVIEQYPQNFHWQENPGMLSILVHKKLTENVIERYCLCVYSRWIRRKNSPQNQIPLFPWIWFSWREAFDAATDAIGWPVDHLCKVCFGVWSGLMVTRNGTLVSPTSC